MQDKIEKAFKYKNLPWFKVKETDTVIDRYERLKTLGISIFEGSHVVKTGEVDESDVIAAKKLFAKGITDTNPEVLASYFEHVILAAELGKRLGGPRAEFILWLHDAGRLITTSFFRNDLINERLLTDFGISKSIIKDLPPLGNLLRVGKLLDLSEEQLKGEKGFDEGQEKLALHYFQSLTPMQRIINLADNFGKRDEEGKIFDLQEFLRYLRSQKTRYAKQSSLRSEDWAIERSQYGAVLQAFVIEKTIEWLEKQGLDFEGILKSLENFGPKFVIVARHGDFLNPSGLIYNTDTVMRQYQRDIIHLSPKGKEQMRRLGELILKRKFRVKQIISSPSARAVESRDSLNTALGISNLETNDELDDVYIPGPVAEGMTMKQHEEMGGESGYDKSKWKKYNHEEPAHATRRMDETFWDMTSRLKTGETGILVSHGDPIAWWINHQVSGNIPNPKNLRNLIYPNKGDAIVAIIDPQGQWFSHYILKDPSLLEGESY